MPKTIRSAFIILWLQLTLSIITISAAFITVSFKADHGFWRGFQDRISAAGGAASLEEYGAYHAGSIFGAIIIPVIFLLGSLWSIRRRWFWLCVVFITFSIIGTFGQGSLPFLSITVLILILSPSAREWLNDKGVTKSTERAEPAATDNAV